MPPSTTAVKPLVQPPPEFAHLTGRRLKKALTTDPTLWFAEDFARESGRGLHTIYQWIAQRNKLDAWHARKPGVTEFRPTDRTPPPFERVRGSACWTAGALRKWMMQVGLMTAAGVLIPPKPTGRPVGRTDGADVRRPPKPSEVRETGPALLAEYNALRQEMPRQADRFAELCKKHNLTERELRRRLEAGRKLARQPMPITAAGAG